MKINMLDSNGFYLGDFIVGISGDILPDNWTSDLVGNGYYKAQYQNATKDQETREWTGGDWVETGGKSQADIEAEHQMMINIANSQRDEMFTQASNMIGALADEIAYLEDDEQPVPDALRVELKAWKKYRIEIKNVDTSKAPDIVWPVAPTK